MNQFKRDLEHELETFTLSEEKKRQIVNRIHQVKTTAKREWTYRFALLLFLMISFGMGILFVQQDSQMLEVSTTSNPLANESIFTIFESDWTKTILLLSIFIAIRFVVGKIFVRKGIKLPNCVYCEEEWTHGEALKIGFKNYEVTCPNCSYAQYKTRKSVRRTSFLYFIIPTGMLVSQLFNNVFLGYITYSFGALWLLISLIPFLSAFQKEDPTKKPLY